jgi:hypothetical protein
MTSTHFRWLLPAFLLVFTTLTARAQSTEEGASSAQKFLDQTHVGGYGEITLGDPNGSEKARLDIPRFVIYLDHYFSDKWAFKSETEIEHVKLSGEGGGEVALEQAFLDYHANNNIGWRGGLLLIPMGIINQTHEPNTFYSVERPVFDQEIIPTTWREIGTGIYGDLAEGIKYQLYISEGLKGEGIGEEGLEEAKQEGSAGAATSEEFAGSDASHPVVSAKLEFIPLAGLRVGASAYFQPQAFDTVPEGSSGSFLMAMLDVRYENGPFHLRGEGGMFTVNEEAAMFNGVPKQATGGYVEAAFNIMPWLSTAASEILPFVRYESFEVKPSVETMEDGKEEEEAESFITGGVAYKPLDNLIFKIDYRWSNSEELPEKGKFSLGAGFSF